jgi:hypothetical protein
VYQEFARGYGVKDEVNDSMTWIKTEVPGYRDQRLTAIVPLLDYLGRVDTDHWGRRAAGVAP